MAEKNCCCRIYCEGTFVKELTGFNDYEEAETEAKQFIKENLRKANMYFLDFFPKARALEEDDYDLEFFTKAAVN